MDWDRIKQYLRLASKGAKNVLTLGQYSQLQESVKEYEYALCNYNASASLFREQEQLFKETISALGAEAEACIELLRDAREFIERLTFSKVSSSLANMPGVQLPDLTPVVRTLSNFETAIVLGKGAGVGVAASVGSWLLVSQFGTASTGAAIGTLSGAAAHNAILAWFGGGALAAGGGGILAGITMLSTIATLPVMFYSTYKAHKEKARVDEERVTVEKATNDNRNLAETLKLAKINADDLRSEFESRRQGFSTIFENIRQRALLLATEFAQDSNTFASQMDRLAQAKGASA